MAVMGLLSMVEKAGFPVLIPALSKRGEPSRNRARKRDDLGIDRGLIARYDGADSAIICGPVVWRGPR